jgi:hypothetical protein
MTIADEAREFAQMYLSGKSIGQIAGLVGMSPGAVRWRLIKGGASFRRRADGIRLACKEATEAKRRIAKEYQAWLAMRERCKNPNNAAFHNYGGRGIIVCSRWDSSFANFLADVGLAPSPQHSLDRYPNQNGNYKPGNVRWATPREQANNLRTNRLIQFDGQTFTLAEWSRRQGLSIKALHMRLKVGWPLDRALTEPLHKTHGGRS